MKLQRYLIIFLMAIALIWSLLNTLDAAVETFLILKHVALICDKIIYFVFIEEIATLCKTNLLTEKS